MYGQFILGYSELVNEGLFWFYMETEICTLWTCTP